MICAAFVLFFAIAFCLSPNAHSQFPTVVFAVAKTRIFEQTNSGAPILDSPTPYLFEAVAQNGLFEVTNGTVTPPNRPAITLVQNFDGGYFEHTAYFSDEGALQSAFPNGDYVAAISTEFGMEFPSISFPATVYPNPPTVTNFDAAQCISSGEDFYLSWNPFVGGAGLDSISVIISDNLGNKVPGMPEESISFNSTSIRIPAGVLSPNQTYRAAIVFFHVVNRNEGFFSPTSLSANFQFDLRFSKDCLHRNPDRNPICARFRVFLPLYIGDW